jgi:hypothetical protein
MKEEWEVERTQLLAEAASEREVNVLTYATDPADPADPADLTVPTKAAS